MKMLQKRSYPAAYESFIQRDFKEDAGVKMIEHQIQKIKDLSIPKTVIIYET